MCVGRKVRDYNKTTNTFRYEFRDKIKENTTGFKEVFYIKNSVNSILDTLTFIAFLMKNEGKKRRSEYVTNLLKPNTPHSRERTGEQKYVSV